MRAEAKENTFVTHSVSYCLTHCFVCLCACMCVYEPTSPPAPLCKPDFFFICYLFVLQYTSFCLCNCFELWKKGGGGGLSEPDGVLQELSGPMTPSHRQ